MTPDTPDDTPGPDLRKAPAAPAPKQLAESIWQPLDGSAPPAPPVQPLVGAWGQPHQGVAAPPEVAVAHQAHAAAADESSDVFTLASWGRRLGAFLIDSIVFGLVGAAIWFPVGMWQGLTSDETIRFFSTLAALPESVAGPAVLYATFVLQRLIVGVLPAFFLARWNGQTPGKRALGICVMCADGSPMTLRVAMTRELLGRTIVIGTLAIVTLGLVGLLSYLWPLWDQERRTGHDAIAKTRVVTAPPK